MSVLFAIKTRNKFSYQICNSLKLIDAIRSILSQIFQAIRELVKDAWKEVEPFLIFICCDDLTTAPHDISFLKRTNKEISSFII